MTALERVVTEGDLSQLKPEERIEYYRQRCEAAGVDPRTVPFQYIKLNGGLQLYATKGATDQMAARRGLSVEVLSREVTEGDIYEVVCRVRDESRRVTEDMGAVSVAGLRGEALANARKKAITQAKRRTILAHCGLGMLDETETEQIPGAARVRVNEHGEIIEEAPSALPEPQADLAHDEAYWQRRAMGRYTEHYGKAPKQGDQWHADCRRRFGAVLGKPVETRTDLEPADWETLAQYDWQQFAFDDDPELPSDEEIERLNAETDERLLHVQAAEQGTYAQAKGF